MSADHTKKEYSIFAIALNLMLACFVSGLVIATTYFFTAPLALEKAAITKTQVMKTLVTEADTFTPIDGKTDWFTASKSGQTIALVVPGESKGYGGKITMLVAVSPEGKVMNFEILKANETPGLGDGANKEPFKKQFTDKNSEALIVTKDPSNTKNIQAMTGATISSKAVTLGVKGAVDEVVQFEGGK
ncbi:FMN-binding protein [Acetobacterium sp.]|uniref:FMN-binding protein n=1 Tax=Acetobacterium sp. TaxID=1872094 RepID=UPI002F41BF8D